MKGFVSVWLVLFFFFGCSQVDKVKSVELISDTTQQKKIFTNIIDIIQENESSNKIDLNDSITILLLPIQAICPSCRKKIIDSIVANKNKLDDRHFIIISANGGKKTIEAFFRERGFPLPNIENKLFLDSVNQAFKSGLYKDKPVFFYGYNKKIFKQVSSIPATIREDLRFYFRMKTS